MRMIFAALLGLSIVTAGATGAAAKLPLREVKAIDDPMFAVALAIEISDKCDEIDARTLKGLSYLWSLKRKASALGYGDAEINTYRKSPAEKARMRARGEAYMKSKGLNPESAADLCTLGHAEIARGSLTGSLLKAR